MGFYGSAKRNDSILLQGRGESSSKHYSRTSEHPMLYPVPNTYPYRCTSTPAAAGTSYVRQYVVETKRQDLLFVLARIQYPATGVGGGRGLLMNLLAALPQRFVHVRKRAGAPTTASPPRPSVPSCPRSRPVPSCPCPCSGPHPTAPRTGDPHGLSPCSL